MKISKILVKIAAPLCCLVALFACNNNEIMPNQQYDESIYGKWYSSKSIDNTTMVESKSRSTYIELGKDNSFNLVQKTFGDSKSNGTYEYDEKEMILSVTVDGVTSNYKVNELTNTQLILSNPDKPEEQILYVR